MNESKSKGEITGLKKASKEVVYPHIFPNADREVGGVLVGRSPKDGGLPLITGAIEAISADEQRATLTFTQDSWEHVHSVIDKEYPNDEIVGWYHSHPNFGIFLSDHDLFIHRNFFGGSSQIALVVDPCNCTEGVFAWNDEGDIEKLYERATPNGWSAPDPEPVFDAGPRAPGTDATLTGPPDRFSVGALTERELLGYAATGIGGVLLGVLLAWALAIGQTTETVFRIVPRNGHSGHSSPGKGKQKERGSSAVTTSSKPTSTSSSGAPTTKPSTNPSN
ncbi:MAG: hypothetical protein WCJ63_08770 [Actinomycetes bacterium]